MRVTYASVGAGMHGYAAYAHYCAKKAANDTLLFHFNCYHHCMSVAEDAYAKTNSDSSRVGLERLARHHRSCVPRYGIARALATPYRPERAATLGREAGLIIELI